MSDVVGWVADPTERGTLQLIWSCLITIFACTWTVLHLNVPAYYDTPRTIVLRKLKWMVITILFPEFILSKAICDLRLALHQLLEFEAYLRECKITWTTTPSEPMFGDVDEFIWKVETPGGCSGFLYDLFRLPRTPSLRQGADEAQPNTMSSSERSVETGLETNDPATCTEEVQQPSAKTYPQREQYRQEEGAQIPGRETQDREGAKEEQWRSFEIPGASLKEHQLHSLKGDTSDLSDGTQGRDRLGIKGGDVEKRPTTQDSQAVAAKTQITSSQGESTRLPGTHDIPKKTFWIIREQKWTILHSYYVQMGGLLYYDPDWDRPLVMTADKLTRRSAWSRETEPKDEHPIKSLILAKDDIEDKSKADWFLKTVAILQVTWIILNTIIRYSTKLPITQLEIASAAFAIMAVLTYLANWWKPKDISQATLLHFKGYLYDRDESPNHLQSFMYRLQKPAQAADHARSRAGYSTRVPNDIVWLEGETPLLFYLIAGSSLIFGGLHCLAWNFEFPTRAELICWRVASVTSAVLPTITLAISALLSYLATSYLGKRFDSELKSRCSDPSHPEWWNLFLEPHAWSPNWDKPAFNDLNLRPAEPPNVEESSPLGHPHVRMAFGPEEEATFYFKRYLVHFRRILSTCRAGTASTLLWKRLGESSYCKPAVQAMRMLLDHPQLLESWLGYENFVKSKLRDLKPPTLGGDTGTYLEEIFEMTWKTVAAAPTFERQCSRASKSVSDVSLTLYAASRLIILVIVFTSLRAAPAGVYRNTTWTRFLPSFS